MSLSLWQVPRLMDRLMDDYIHEINRSVFPYWRNADHSMLHVGKDTQEVVDDDKKFAVSLDVSQFRPEDLKVHLDGRELTVEGKQEHKGENSFIHRSFVRKWTLPDTVDLGCYVSISGSCAGSRSGNYTILNQHTICRGARDV